MDKHKFSYLLTNYFILTKSSNTDNLSIDMIENETKNIANAFNYAFNASTKVSSRKPSKFPSYFNKTLIELRRKTRNQFNSSYKSGDWTEYKKLRNIYKKERRKTKSQEWKDYCSAIESTKDTARLRKILSRVPSSSSFVKNADGSWAESIMETNEILLETHFPGCIHFNPG